MADTDKTVAYAVDANADGFVAAMQRSRAAAQESAKGVEQAFAGLGNVFKTVQGAFGGMLAVFAGGAAFAQAINVTKEWGAETGKLSKQLQITTADATAYQVAAKTLGVDVGTIVDASDKMTKQLVKNETAFQTLGVQTRNANGSFRSTGDLLPEVMDKLRGITNTTEQNAAGLQIFGKGWTEVRGLMKLGAEEMDRARQKARDLNLEVDPAAVKKYNAALADIKLIVTSLSIQVGNALLPVLTELGAWFGQVGPYVVGAFDVVLKTVMTTVTAVWTTIKATVQAAAGLVAALVEVIEGNYSKAWGIVKDVGSQTAKVFTDGYDNAVKLWQPKLPKADIEKSDGGPHLDFEKAKQAKENIVQLWQTQLEERKLNLQEQAQAEGRFEEMSKADERAYWQSKLALTTAGSKEQLEVRRKIATLGLDILKDEFATQQAQLQAQQQAYKNNLEARGAILQQEAELVAQKYGQHSKEYAAVQGKITALAREGVAQRQAIEEVGLQQQRAMQLARVDADQAALQLDLDLQKLTHAQYLQAEQQLEQRRYQIKLDALGDKLRLLALDPDRNPVEIARVNAEIEQLEIQHQAKLLEISNRAVVEQSKPMLALSATLESSLQQLGQRMLTDWRSVGSALRGTFSTIGNALIAELVTKPLAAKAAAWVRERALKLASVEANAVEAGSGAAASQASIPYIGPVLAIAAMASMLSTVRGLSGSIPSAAGGWEVPHDTLAMVHEKEMILPAQIAQPLKQQLADGSFGAGQGGQVNVLIAAHPMPGNYFMVHRDQLVKALQSAVRDNAWRPGK